MQLQYGTVLMFHYDPDMSLFDIVQVRAVSHNTTVSVIMHAKGCPVCHPISHYSVRHVVKIKVDFSALLKSRYLLFRKRKSYFFFLI